MGQDRETTTTKTSSMRIGFIGLGTMGYLMAGHVSRGGYDIAAYNRRGNVAEKWNAEHKGRQAKSPADAAADADIVISCVSDDTAVRSVTVGPEGAFSAMKRGSIYVDHTTCSAALSQELNERAKEKGVGFLDAPVTGGKPGAAKGSLTAMVGGDPAVLDRAREVISTYTKVVAHVGPSGAGQIAKMANQMCIGGILQSLAEALGLVEHAGLDASRILQVLVTGSGKSWQMENRGVNMLEGKYDFGFSVELLAKDLGLCLEEAQRRKMAIPATLVVEGSYRTLIERGFKSEDVAAVMRLFR